MMIAHSLFLLKLHEDKGGEGNRSNGGGEGRGGRGGKNMQRQWQI